MLKNNEIFSATAGDFSDCKKYSEVQFKLFNSQGTSFFGFSPGLPKPLDNLVCEIKNLIPFAPIS